MPAKIRAYERKVIIFREYISRNTTTTTTRQLSRSFHSLATKREYSTPFTLRPHCARYRTTRSAVTPAVRLRSSSSRALRIRAKSPKVARNRVFPRALNILHTDGITAVAGLEQSYDPASSSIQRSRRDTLARRCTRKRTIEKRERERER